MFVWHVMTFDNQETLFPGTTGISKGPVGSDSVSNTESESDACLGSNTTTILEDEDQEILTAGDSDIDRMEDEPMENGVQETSFINLLRTNRAFRLYISSYLITCAGE